MPYDPHHRRCPWQSGQAVVPDKKALRGTGHHYIIICGDFGFLPGNVPVTENVTYLWVDGNHECFPLLRHVPVTEWHGARVQIVQNNLIYIQRGEIFELEGMTFLCLGGAASADKKWRQAHGWSWFAEELPSPDQIANAWNNLARHNYQVDVVITHTAPSIVQQALDYQSLPEEAFLVQTLDNIFQQTTIRRGWYFGHYHEDRTLQFLGTSFCCSLNAIHTLD